MTPFIRRMSTWNAELPSCQASRNRPRCEKRRTLQRVTGAQAGRVRCLAHCQTKQHRVDKGGVNWRRPEAVSRPPRRNSFSTIDTGHRSRHRPDGGSPPACKAHRDHHNGSVRNAKQARANSENNRRIGAAPVGPRTYALTRCEFREAAHRCAEDSKGPRRVCHQHGRVPGTLG
jgi:hypothetical protein